ncbi:tRNA pseudouridine(55) synthase TruB [Corynebacterium sp. c9Ua_112]|uniref:tRNA pseudouridine synthase B n=1 Tax=Corynebacterium macclintockiae TaxID=2913501 RepID=A0A9X3RQT7_9CORY|nr:tRNA pseudouridine(55) synthase TruB [Corynebacterium macclintockiae]MCZ9304342.1 tRNA pseudouridine(55) synthase TruB [Corynebacterium macclintockiae]
MNQRTGTSILDRSGVVLVDKPSGPTSHDMVAKLRRIMGTRRVGHSGTLDPMATGLLVVGVERGTKFLAHVVAHDKRYEATVRLGAATHTDDAEGEVLSTAAPADLEALTEERIHAAFDAQRGDIMQRPTSVSSIKIDGKRAHELVREGQEVVLPERPVTIFSLEVLDVVFGVDATSCIDVRISVHCSSGTYIRAIARDVGEALGVGGHLTQLRRTSVGPFDISEARTLEQLEKAPQLSLNLDEAMVRCFDVREVSESEGVDLSLGKWLQPVGHKGVHAAVTPSGRAIALVEEKGKRAASVFVARPAGMD